MTTTEMLTTSQVCERAQVTRQTLARWVRMGLCPSPVKLGPRALRFRRSDVEQWFRNGGVHVGHGPIPTEGGWVTSDEPADAETLAAIDETE